ncbi:MAG TPA: type II toxin-antitoxin system HicA family toxin [Candidatus Hydrogenedentes bacterium]|nr:type II toxin-antitoxin system HicA family toxin [Candidatus Hydrogenedentota bacterium]
MPPFGPVKRRDLTRFLRACGYQGPYSGEKHQFMTRGELTLRIPNPHQGEVGSGLLGAILRQAEVSREQWESL